MHYQQSSTEATEFNVNMNSDSELAMAVVTQLNFILHEIQQTNLNFMINLTPYAAYVTIKKSTQVDKNGSSILPSPPVFRLLDECLREKVDADNEIKMLKELLNKSEIHCKDLAQENIELVEKLNSSNDKLNLAQGLNEDLQKTIEAKKKEVNTIRLEKEKIKHELSAREKTYHESIYESKCEISSLKKQLKHSEKEVYTLNSKFFNRGTFIHWSHNK